MGGCSSKPARSNVIPVSPAVAAATSSNRLPPPQLITASSSPAPGSANYKQQTGQQQQQLRSMNSSANSSGSLSRLRTVTSGGTTPGSGIYPTNRSEGNDSHISISYDVESPSKFVSKQKKHGQPPVHAAATAWGTDGGPKAAHGATATATASASAGAGMGAGAGAALGSPSPAKSALGKHTDMSMSLPNMTPPGRDDAPAKLSALQEGAAHSASHGDMSELHDNAAATLTAKGTERRVAMALSSRKLAIQRRRRLSIKGKSFQDLLGVGRHTADSPTVKAKGAPKTQEQRSAIKESLVTCFLFSSLQQVELDDIVNCMVASSAMAGEVVIAEGDSGDKFYVHESGAPFEVVVKGDTVGSIQPGGNFGELALLYDCPRAATVQATGPAKLWTLDRDTFRRIVITTANQTLADNRRWLQRVALLSRLDDPAISKLAEALVPVQFAAQEVIIKQGDDGDIFYLIKSGTVKVTQTSKKLPWTLDADEAKVEEQGIDSAPVTLMELGEGDHFGERALLTSEPRAASVTAKTPVVCMALDRDAFHTLLGPLEDVMEVTHSKRKQVARKAQQEEKPPDKKRGQPRQPAKSGPTGRIIADPAGVERLRTDCNLETLRPVAVLGEGAFGVVQLVQHKTTGEVFALKQMQKARIVQTGQQRNVMNERAVLVSATHPYILKLENAFQDRDCLYLVLEFLQGGDIFGHLYKQGGRFDSSTSLFYAATVLTVLEYLHKRSIVYRDLKPENLVLDSRGFMKVVDFGFAKEVRERTFTLCGTPEYLAPELVQGKGHNRAVDYWALGILIYEMLQGYSPFADEENNDQMTVYRAIIRGKVVFSSRLKDYDAIDLIMKLLVGNASKRLGSGRHGIDHIKGHRWFRGVNWANMLQKRVLPPIIPRSDGKLDTRNFEDIQPTGRVNQRYIDDGSGWCDEF